MQKKVLSLFLCVFMLLSLTACDVESTQPNYSSDSPKSSPAALIAQNNKYKLEWSSDNYGVVLTDLETGLTWGTSPEKSEEVELDELGMPIRRHSMVDSVLSVYYRDTTTDSLVEINSYDVVTSVNHEKIENGIRVEYYFNSVEFMIPVDYVLCDDYVNVSIDPSKIQEGKNRIISVSVAPFWCSAENDSENSYLFVPSGSGAVVSTKSLSQQGRTYSASVYGEDLSMEQLYDSSETAEARFPVYGAVSGNKGSFALIETGDSSSLIKTVAGSTAYGYSTVYTTYQLRGYTMHKSVIFGNIGTTNLIYSQKMVTTPLSIRFYPIQGENVGYDDMAKIYRNYLLEESMLSESKGDATLNINVLGGSMIVKSFLGIPYKTLFPTTTLSQASQILSDLNDEIGKSFSVNLKGFGATGVDIGGVAGDFAINKKLGTVGDLNKLSELCDEKDVDLYMDFDFVRFNSGGNGFSTLLDNISTSGNQRVTEFVYHITTRHQKDKEYYSLLSPARFTDAAKKLMDKSSDWKLDGVSLSTLSNLSYSDYSNSDSSLYYSKDGFDVAVSDAVKTVKENGKFMASKANLYAAVMADIITDVPTSSSSEHIFEYDVPFYEMVLKGYVPMTVESINLSTSPQKIILNAVETGCGLNYTVMSQWDVSLIDAQYPYFYNSLYKDVKDDIVSTVTELSDYYEKVSGAHIESHSVLENDVRETVFDNGVTVYVNYSDIAQQTPIGEVPALSYLMGGDMS